MASLQLRSEARSEARTEARSDARIEARVSQEQKELFDRAAAIEGVSLTAFAISTMHRAAVNLIQEHSNMVLSVRNQRTFVDALMNPPEPNEALRNAAKAYRRMK